MKSTMMADPLSLHHVVERAKRLFPSSSVVSSMPDGTRRAHTFAQVVERAEALALALKALGVGPGDRVATLCWNHHVHLECYFGIPLAGAVLHTLNLRLTPQEIAWIARDGGARVAIVDDVLLPLYARIAEHHAFETIVVHSFGGEAAAAVASGARTGIPYEALIGPHLGKPCVPPTHEENDPVAMCYTSGTTGRPKGVVYSHRSTVLHALVASLPDICGLSGRDRMLVFTPMFHVNAWGMPFAALMHGTRVIFPGMHLDAERVLDLICEQQPTIAFGVPTFWLAIRQAMERAPDRWRLPQGMRCLAGGAPVPESLAACFAERAVHIVPGWGMTETSPLGTLNYRSPEWAARSSPDAPFPHTAAGIVVPLVRIRIQGAEGELPWDGASAGEIQVRGPTITGGYQGIERDPEKHTEDGWLRTGDVGTIDSCGYLRITDRLKDMVKSGGEWISSVALENALMGHPAVAEAAVIAVPHEKWQERPIACIVFRAGRTATPEELNGFLSASFSKWQLPDRYEVLTELPKTSTGKFWKLKLRERFPR